MPQLSLKSQFLLLVALAFGSAAHPAALLAQSSAGTRILVCESADNACSQPNAHLDILWTFNGIAGTATSAANSAPSHLTIQKFDSSAMVVQRVDDSGTTAGLTATYSGIVKGTQISGTVQWSWPGHPDYPSNGTFSAIIQDSVAAAPPPPASQSVASTALPSNLLVCENHGACNAAWILNGNTGTGTWFARNTVKANLTVDRNDPDYIRIRRTDTTGGVSAVYAGSRHGDQYSGTIIYSSPDHPGGATGTWTASIPQTTCDPKSGLDAADAVRIGQYALMFHRDRDALGCYTAAATAGDANAQMVVGLIYYQGKGDIAQDYKQAFVFLHKAADQGDYHAQRLVAEMYAAGQGTAKDPTLAGIYTARADEQKHDFERQQDLAERAADRNAQIMSSFVLGASFGIFSDF